MGNTILEYKKLVYSTVDFSYCLNGSGLLVNWTVSNSNKHISGHGNCQFFGKRLIITTVTKLMIIVIADIQPTIMI